jgi:hypothetical protein
MSYQNALPFDEEYAWLNLIKAIKKLSQGQKLVYYGIHQKKVTFRCLYKSRFIITSYSINALKYTVEDDRHLTFTEVEFMSTVVKPNVKHVHSFVKGLTKNEDWRKQVYRCSDSNCSHYNQAQFIVGKNINCASCGDRTIADYEQIRHRNRKLICLNCSKSPRKELVRNVMDDLEKLFDNSEQSEGDEHVESPKNVN